MAKSHPEDVRPISSARAPRLALWARHTVSSFALAASLLSLGIILHNQYGPRLAAAIMQGLDAIQLAELVPMAAAEPAKPATPDRDATRHRAIGEYLARRYRVSSDVTTEIVAKAHRAGSQLKVDPLLILAVISVESRFNPIAESTMGAKGLMQVIPRFHSDKFERLGGEKVAFEPLANITVGSQILREYIREAGDLNGALQRYVGASSEDTENGYAAKVMAERERLEQVLRQLQPAKRAVRASKPPATVANAADAI